MPLTSLTDLELLRDLRELVDVFNVAHDPHALALLNQVDTVLAQVGPSPQPAHVSALTAREMFDLIRTNPGCWVEWMGDCDADEPSLGAGPVLCATYDPGDRQCRIHTLDAEAWEYPPTASFLEDEDEDEDEGDRPQCGVALLRAADGRVIWRRPPEAPVRCGAPAPEPRTVLSCADLDGGGLDPWNDNDDLFDPDPANLFADDDSGADT